MTGLTRSAGLMKLSVDEEITQRLHEFVKDKDAFSPNTWKQLLSVMRLSLRWSKENGRTFLPMASNDLRDYLIHLQETGKSTGTISNHASMISMLHRHAGLVAPNSSPAVARAIKKINRVAVVSGERTGQAVPFHFSDLLAVDELWGNSPRKQDIRNLAFLHVAYSTLLRRSELGRIRVRDISRAEDGRIILDVAYTKTIVQTAGVIKALSTSSSQRLTEWIDAAGLATEPDAYVFCRVHRSNKAIINTTSPLSPTALDDIFIQAWAAVGHADQITNKDRYSGWSAHSCRVGAAQDMAADGYAVAQIMQEGTWKKTETLMRYIRNVEAHKGAMVDMMENRAKR